MRNRAKCATTTDNNERYEPADHAAMNAPFRFALRLLGGFALERDGQPVELAYGKGRALLAYLAAEPGRAHARHTLARLLWPDLDRGAGLANLRQVLHDLRQVLDVDPQGQPLLETNRENVRLVLPAQAEVDTAAFGEPLTVCPPAPTREHCEACLARMSGLAALYRGDFLADYSLPDCPDFDEWLQSRRDALQLRALGLLTRLADCHESLGADGAALVHALRLLDFEPWNEEFLLRAMRLLALNGRQDEALARYEAACRLLQRDFGVGPAEATRAMAERIRRGEFSPSPQAGAARQVAPCSDAPPAERRQIAVLRCELAGGSDDPDDFFADRQAPLAQGEDIVRAHGGLPQRDRAGGLLGYFGYPQTGGDTVPRALRAAQAIAEAGIDVCVGVHAGIALCGGDPDRGAAIDAGGAVTRIAGHLSLAAAPGEVALSDAARRLAAGHFACSADEAGRTWRLGPASGARNRLEARAAAGCAVAPLLGRQAESALLRAAWQAAGAGARRAVLLRGEAGCGKSHLAFDFAAGLDLPANRCQTIFCNSSMRELPPLAVPPPGRPLLLIVEDLQRAPPACVEALARLAAAPMPLLLLLTSRGAAAPHWPAQDLTVLELGGLDDAAIAALVAPACHPAEAARICARAEGNPLHAEELALAPGGEMLPATLRDLLAERCNGLGAALHVAQAAAAIGREFSAALLDRVADCDPQAAIEKLAAAGLIERCADDTWRFRQALLHEAIYDSLPRAARSALHGKIAAALQAARPPAPPEQLAQHWAAAGELPQAVACWLAAGRSGAGLEAMARYRAGLELVARLPAGPDRLRLELELQTGLGAAACAVEGYASAAGAAAYARARELCAAQPGGPDLFAALWGLWASASSSGGFPHALELARQLRRMADASGDPLQEQQAEFALGNIHFWRGEFTAARMHLERALAAYRPDRHAAHIAAFGEDGGVTAGAYLGWVLWSLGLPEQAQRASAASLALARRQGHPTSLAYALTFAALLHCRLRQPDKAQALAREVLGLAGSHGFTLWRVGATLVGGWAQVMRQRPAGIDSMAQCVDAMQAAMGGVVLTVLEPLADAQVALGRYEDALATCAQARLAGAALGDRHIEAELQRLEGEALLGLGEPAAADACFRAALATARQQGARALELRAAASRLRARPADSAARDELAAILAASPEGRATPDQRDARRLLEPAA